MAADGTAARERGRRRGGRSARRTGASRVRDRLAAALLLRLRQVPRALTLAEPFGLERRQPADVDVHEDREVDPEGEGDEHEGRLREQEHRAHNERDDVYPEGPWPGGG